MKKILTLLSILLIGQITLAQTDEINYIELMQTTSMPSDAEIRQIVDKFNFTPEEKEQLFAETKRQIEELYKTQDAQALQQRALQGKQMLNSAGLTIQDFMVPQQ